MGLLPSEIDDLVIEYSLVRKVIGNLWDPSPPEILFLDFKVVTVLVVWGSVVSID